jgi:hemolysin III
MAKVKKEKPVEAYSPEEELANTITHGLGVVLGIAGTIMLLLKAETSVVKWSFLVFGLSLINLYTASTLYHAVKSKQRKFFFKKLDHIGIYLLIAGTFTPFAWGVLGAERLGQQVLLWVWLIALAGVVFKIFLTGKYEAISLISYLGMGWLGFLMFDRLAEVLSPDAVNLMLYGGLCYTGGVVFYLMRKLKYHHAIWHLFVLGGSAFHFAAVYVYVGG